MMLADSSIKTYKLSKEGLTILLSGLAGLIYNSWPLGFILDPVVARYNQASQLETIGHPYYQFFIACDVISSLLVILSAILILLRFTKKIELKLIAIGLIAFGIFTITTSLLPAKCTITSYFRCGVGYAHGVGLDLIFSSLAILGLMLSLSALLRLLINAHLIKAAFGYLFVAITALWILALFFFSLLAIKQVPAANIVQYVELTLAGLELVILAIGIRATAV